MTSRRCHRRQAGFSLIEVMAAVLLLGTALIVMLQLRNESISRAAQARNLSVASRLSLYLMHQIEAARIPDLFDGFQGDFGAEGYPEFSYIVGVGDGSAYTTGMSFDPTEALWRNQKQLQEQEREVEEGEEEDKPPFTRVFITVRYPGSGLDEDDEFGIETMLPTWAIEQDFELYEATWASNFPTELE